MTFIFLLKLITTIYLLLERRISDSFNCNGEYKLVGPGLRLNFGVLSDVYFIIPSELRAIICSGSKLAGIDTALFVHLGNLRTLNLSENKIKNQFFDLNRLRGLKNLNLSGNLIEDKKLVIKSRKKTDILESLDLSKNLLTNAESLLKMQLGFQKLNLSGNYFTKIPPEALLDSTSTEELDFSNNLVSKIDGSFFYEKIWSKVCPQKVFVKCISPEADFAEKLQTYLVKQAELGFDTSCIPSFLPLCGTLEAKRKKDSVVFTITVQKSKFSVIKEKVELIFSSESFKNKTEFIIIETKDVEFKTDFEFIIPLKEKSDLLEIDVYDKQKTLESFRDSISNIIFLASEAVKFNEFSYLYMKQKKIKLSLPNKPLCANKIRIHYDFSLFEKNYKLIITILILILIIEVVFILYKQNKTCLTNFIFNKPRAF